jgi:hypothetical protein
MSLIAPNDSHIPYATAMCFIFVTLHILSGGKSPGPMCWRGSSGAYLSWSCADVRQQFSSHKAPASSGSKQLSQASSKQPESERRRSFLKIFLLIQRCLVCVGPTTKGNTTAAPLLRGRPPSFGPC